MRTRTSPQSNRCGFSMWSIFNKKPIVHQLDEYISYRSGFSETAFKEDVYVLGEFLNVNNFTDVVDITLADVNNFLSASRTPFTMTKRVRILRRFVRYFKPYSLNVLDYRLVEEVGLQTVRSCDNIIPMRAKTERNRLIVKLIKEGWSHGKVQKEMGFKSRGTVSRIYYRDKDKFRFTKLSTV